MQKLHLSLTIQKSKFAFSKRYKIEKNANKLNLAFVFLLFILKLFSYFESRLNLFLFFLILFSKALFKHCSSFEVFLGVEDILKVN